ncbi:phosphatase [Wolinella succinogenes]|uniref:Ppx/GppA phosphatase family protein n=1 Tax=Wolinella succinogenes TaxID=844 RepID=UPI002FC58C7F
MIGIDLGSNTLRAVSLDAKFERKGAFERIVRTAEGLDQSGLISPNALERILSAITELRERFDLSEPYEAVATAALRRAKNQKEILLALEKRGGIAFRVIDAQEEATLTALAAQGALKRLGIEQEFVMVDIGGGSTEVLFFRRGEMISQSFEMGILTFKERYGISHGLESKLYEIGSEIKEFARDMIHSGFKPELFVGVGGTPATLASLKAGMSYASYDYQKIEGMKLTPPLIKKELEKLLRLPLKERERLAGAGKSELLEVGVKIFETLFLALGFRECLIVDDSLREGVAISALKKATQQN